MKNYNLLLLTLFFILSGCSDEKDSLLFPENYDEVQRVVGNGELLKQVIQQGENYLFEFESQTIEMSANKISAIQVNKEAWITTVIFDNGSAYIIPSLGTSIDNLITSVTINPSGYNPLAANVKIELPALGCIKIIVHSKKGARTTDIEHVFTEIGKSQTILILGLYPNYENQVTLIYSDKHGNERARTILRIPIKPLPSLYLPAIRVIKADVDKMEPGLNLINSPGKEETDTSIPYMVDADGEIRWLLNWKNHPELKHIGAQCGLVRMKNGNYLTNDANNNQIVEVNLIGEVIHKWDMLSYGYTCHHAVTEKEDGKILATVSKTTAKLANGKNVRINDHIIEFDPIKEVVVQEWDLANMIDSARYTIPDPSLPGAAFAQNASNWAHNNAIEEFGNDYLATIRFQGILKYNHSGDVNWIISPHRDWQQKFKKYLLEPLHFDGTPITDAEIISGEKACEDFDWPWGPHCALTLPNGHIMVFDNGYGRHFDVSHFSDKRLYSRIVEYEVDEKNRTVRQVWQFGEELGHDYYAAAMSGIQYLPGTKNRLFCPGMGNTLSNGCTGGRIVEINLENEKVVFEMELEATAMTIFHRANRLHLYPEQ